MKLIAASATAAALAVGFVIVRPPALAPARQVEGATAACRDGTTSSSKHRPGTCSHHAGVLAFEHEPPRPVAVGQGDALVHAAQQAERRACAGLTVDEPWTSCAAR